MRGEGGGRPVQRYHRRAKPSQAISRVIVERRDALPIANLDVLYHFDGS